MEITVALVIISVLGIIVWHGVARVSVFLTRIHTANAEVRGQLMMEAEIRRQVSMIRVPFWMPGVPVSESDGEVRIGFYNGRPQNELFFRFSEGHLLMGCDDGTGERLLQRYGPYETVTVKTIHGRSGGEILVAMSFYKAGRENGPLVISTGIRSLPFCGMDLK